MQNIILFDDRRTSFLPLTYTRPVAELRIGVLTVREKWARCFEQAQISYKTADYLNAQKYPLHYERQNILINATILPNPQLVEAIKMLPPNRVLVKGEQAIALKVDQTQAEAFFVQQLSPNIEAVETEASFIQLQHIWDLFKLNAPALEEDFVLLTKGRKSKPLSPTNQVIGDPNRIFLEEGASAECAVFNTENGPIYLGKNAKVMEGALIRGGLALCEHAQLKMGAKIYGAATFGPYVKVGGEVTNSVFLGYSNKGHEGYLGNSVIGEWCNLGADTNSSNLKNNYKKVRVWNYDDQSFARTDLQFCGLLMGDHSKSGINTMFNTATVVGVSTNIYGSGFPRKFIPSFSWGGSKGYQTYELEKALETANIVMQRRNQFLTEADAAILQKVFEETAQFRNWE